MTKAKRFSLIFPKMRGLHGGWSILVEKLCSLGVVCAIEVRKEVITVEKRSSSRVEWSQEMRPLRTQLRRIWAWWEMWFGFSLGSKVQSREKQYKCCLVGKLDEGSILVPKLGSMKRWAIDL